MPLGAFFLLFLAAYTAVNSVLGYQPRILLFLAAYTAVNRAQAVDVLAFLFLAAYTAVNLHHAPLSSGAVFLAAYTAVNIEYAVDLATDGFLSCLHGSELAPKTYNHLKEKEIQGVPGLKPSFFKSLQLIDFQGRKKPSEKRVGSFGQSEAVSR